MKNILMLFILILISGFLSVFPVLAQGSAIFSFGSFPQNVETGERFTFEILVEPNGENLDTVRAELSFSADVLEIESFHLGDLFPRVTPGNVIDNTSGLFSQGAFTLEGPVRTSGIFGTITFITKQEGTAVIELLGSSKLISAGEEKINSEKLERVSFSIQTQEQPEEKELVVTSSTHVEQDQWYSSDVANFSWKINQDILRYYSDFDQNPNTDPRTLLEQGTLKRTIEEIKDGVWFFHLKGQKKDGTFTNTEHYKVQIDTTPPNAIFPLISDRQIAEGTDVTIEFGTTDEMSGVFSYELSINDGPFLPSVSPIILSDLKPGDYYVKVRALDKAGNAIYGLETLRVYPKGLLTEEEQGGTKESILAEGTKIALLIIIILGIILIFGIIKKRANKKSKN